MTFWPAVAVPLGQCRQDPDHSKGCWQRKELGPGVPVFPSAPSSASFLHVPTTLSRRTIAKTKVGPTAALMSLGERNLAGKLNGLRGGRH